MKIDIEKKNEHEIYNLRLHHSCNLNDYTRITRVPGGWIYLHSPINPNIEQLIMTFVPFSNEFSGNEDGES